MEISYSMCDYFCSSCNCLYYKYIFKVLLLWESNISLWWKATQLHIEIRHVSVLHQGGLDYNALLDEQTIVMACLLFLHINVLMLWCDVSYPWQAQFNPLFLFFPIIYRNERKWGIVETIAQKPLIELAVPT